MDLQALSDFNLVATPGGIGRASRVSGRSKATLRKVAELEQSLGVRLIERGSQSLRLTEEGRALHERTDGPLAEIAEARQAVVLGASTPRGRLIPIRVAGDSWPDSHSGEFMIRGLANGGVRHDDADYAALGLFCR